MDNDGKSQHSGIKMKKHGPVSHQLQAQRVPALLQLPKYDLMAINFVSFLILNVGKLLFQTILQVIKPKSHQTVKRNVFFFVLLVESFKGKQLIQTIKELLSEK